MKIQTRPNGAWETTRKKGPWRRLTLRRSDGEVYLDRWGVSFDRLGGILLHRMEAGDPGIDLHDHPWWFMSIILWGGYIEQRAETRLAILYAQLAEAYPESSKRGVVEERKWLSAKTMRLDECHTITKLKRKTSWSLVIKGPRRRRWGFYMPGGWLCEFDYDKTVRADRRDMVVES